MLWEAIFISSVHTIIWSYWNEHTSAWSLNAHPWPNTLYVARPDQFFLIEIQFVLIGTWYVGLKSTSVGRGSHQNSVYKCSRRLSDFFHITYPLNREKTLKSDEIRSDSRVMGIFVISHVPSNREEFSQLQYAFEPRVNFRIARARS
jgi:hypothetical protein